MKALPTKKKIVFTIIFILSVIAFTARSQKVGLGIQASINHTLIPDIEKKPFINQQPLTTGYSMPSKPGVREAYKEKLGGNINLNIDINLTKQIFVRTGIGFSLQRFNRKVVDENQQALNIGNNMVSKNVGLGNTSILYADIPLLAGVNLFNNKVNICAGASTSILTYSIQDAERMYNDNISPYGLITTKTVKVKDKSNEGLNDVLFNINSSLTYNIARKISLFSRYSKQLTPLYKKKYQYAGKAKLHSFELGLEFRIR